MLKFQRFSNINNPFEVYEASYMVNKGGGEVELYRVDPTGETGDQLVAVYHLEKGWSIRQI